MPIQWTVSHPERLVIATVSGEAHREDFDRYLAEVNDAGAMPYRKILNLTFAPLAVRAADIRALGRSVYDYALMAGRLGPFAIVVDADSTHDASAMFGETARVDRPFAIFRTLAQARAWLDALEQPATG